MGSTTCALALILVTLHLLQVYRRGKRIMRIQGPQLKLVGWLRRYNEFCFYYL